MRRGTEEMISVRPFSILYKFAALILIIGLVAMFACPTVSASNASKNKQALRFVEHTSDQTYTIVDSEGNEVSKLAHEVSKGDYLITEDNRGWEVTKVVGYKAYAKSDGIVNLASDETEKASLGSAVTNIWNQLRTAVGMGGSSKGTIGIYHTHSDESYQPTSGVANEEKGDIYQVGTALAEALRKRGFKVVQSMNNHNPHDAAAYIRSRRTAAELSKEKPIALIDVHRDAIPDPSYYERQVSGEEIAATRVVVGKQNANNKVNFEFAKRLKAQADKDHPGLVKEIYWGRGNYNQDLGARTILLEFGTHTNPEQLANRAAALMADILPAAIGTTGADNARGGSSLIWLVGGVIVIGGAFLFLNKDKMEFFKGKGGTAAAGFLGKLRKRQRK